MTIVNSDLQWGGMDNEVQNGRGRTVATLSNAICGGIDGPLSEEALANRVGYSLVHVRRIFQAAMGEPLVTFIRRLRLERAAGRLSLGEQRIGTVAGDAQYN